MIAALYVDPAGCYSGLPEVDLWPETRDARRYSGPWPVVAHPPCSRWCLLAGLIQHRWGHKVGEDGGLFAAALESVRRFGGVLEHPAWSRAWSAYGLPEPPTAGGWLREMFGPGWVCSIAQSAYGHDARKATWLYYVGINPPADLAWSRPRGSSLVSWADSSRGMPRVGKRRASATPPAMRDALMSLARSCGGAP